MKSSNLKAVIVIPARAGSTRFPNKPMAMIRGKSMLHRVWRIAETQAIPGEIEVVIATDDLQIRDHAQTFGAKVVYSDAQCNNGTERTFATLTQLQLKPEVAINLQGDAVLTPPWVLKSLLDAMLPSHASDHVDPVLHSPATPAPVIATPAIHLSWRQFDEYAQAKATGKASGTLVVFDLKKNALFFSKGIIPHLRSSKSTDRAHESPYYRHIGTYAYRYETLRTLVSCPPTVLEKTEQLEQLRALELGIPIRVVTVDYQGRTHGSVDHAEDIPVIERIIDQEGELVP